MSQMLVTVFNDQDPNNKQELESAIKSIDNINRLKYSPKVYNQSVGEEIVRLFEKMRLVPTLCFIDPWGYKGLSLRLVNSVLKDWGCDCVFFFNYNRINMGLSNQCVREHMVALFGEERYDQLRPCLDNLNPNQRELTIVEELTKSLLDMGGKYVLPFRFKDEKNSRTSHHLFFVTKGFKGYEIMKEIMAKMSSENTDGVPSFEYHRAGPEQLMLFKMSRPIEELRGMLLGEFAGQSLTMREIYEKHSVGTPYIERNYKSVLNQLEETGMIAASPPAGRRPLRNGERTFSGKTMVVFPPERE